MLKKLLLLIITATIFTMQTSNLIGKIPMIITASLADFRASPHAIPLGLKGPALSQDIKGQGEGQISQLLFGETVFAEQVPGFPEWLKVTTLEQRDHDKNPMIGYIQKNTATKVPKFSPYNLIVVRDNATIQLMSIDKTAIIALPFGAKLSGKYRREDNCWIINFSPTLQGIVEPHDVEEQNNLSTKTEKELRESIINTAKKFLKTPYVWGGRSMKQATLNNVLTGIDCSNLLSLVFSMHSMEIPRNSRSQQLAAKKIATGSSLEPGDALFFTSNNSKQMCHVALYIGDNKIIEATAHLFVKNFSSASLYPEDRRKDLGVRIISLKEYLGLDVEELVNGMQITHGTRKGATLYLGSFFNTTTQPQAPA